MIMTRGGRFDNLDKAWDGQHLKARHQPAQALWSEDLIKMRHSMTGQRFDGCPTWHPTRLADGTPMREKFNEADYPFLMTSYKSNLMSSMAIAVERLRQVHPHNPISINREDAARLGIGNGKKIRVTSPGGSITGVAIVRDGVMKGAIAIEHGYGHWELGARSHQIDGKANCASTTAPFSSMTRISRRPCANACRRVVSMGNDRPTLFSRTPASASICGEISSRRSTSIKS